ncbi:tRNA pseudouridine(55) synthase TruB [Ruminococcaceae bacterium OttesenSCG-928-L11]|nr:tRNA pseudouridine(55) synthase TruB [Ruminococcaceae bacterium OttesenSCG-928-L11]
MSGNNGASPSLTGILCIDKPADFTSFDVVAKMRGILRTRKIGHGGTLDPMATGVLPIFVGRATKACDILPDQDKRYTARFRLGVETDTQDCTGTVLAERPVTATSAQVEAALEQFRGPIAQVPPMYSAVRVEGKRLYELARSGVEVERKPRDITVYSLELLEADEARHEYSIDIACSKGTYVRTICHDIGQLLGCGAAMTALRRTRACGYELEQCVTLEQLQKLRDSDRLESVLLPTDSAFARYDRLELDERQTRLFRNGVPLALSRMKLPARDGSGVRRIYGHDGAFLAIAQTDWERDALVSHKRFDLPQ